MTFARKIGFPQILFAPDGDGSSGGGTSTGATGAPAGGGSEPPTAPSSTTPSGASPSPSPTSPSGAATSPDGGASVSPPSPAPAPPTSARTPIGSSFEFLDESDDDVDELTELASPAAPAAPAPAQPVTAPAPAATPAQAAPAQAPTTPAATPAPGPQEATPPIPSPAEPHKIAEQMQANFDALADHMAANEFKLSEADVEALETDAPAHIPKIMARLYMKTQINMMQQLARIVPEMYQRFTAVTARNEKNEGKFYTRWPSINREQHGDTVKRLANTYRQMNPAATLEQMIEDLGPIVMMTAKIPLNAPPAANGSGIPAVAPPTRTPPSPFKPAIPGSGASQQSGAGDNPWGGLAGDQNEE